MERETRDFGFDMSTIYINLYQCGEKGLSKAIEDRTVIDLERYRILKTMRTVLNVR